VLSRVADCLYWMSRYLERAEHTARLLDVQQYQGLDQRAGPLGAGPVERRWYRLLAALRAPAVMDGLDPYAITQSLVFDTANSASIVSCVEEARDNARQVREQISSEMWEQLNRLYLQVRNTSMDDLWHAEPHEFYKTVREGAHLFQGITDATISHGEGWHFIQLGRYIERAGATVSLLDTYYTAYLEAQRGEETQGMDGDSDMVPTELGYLDWVGLLKSCTAFEAYSKVYTADVRPDRIAEFLLLDAEFPRSLRFMAATIQVALQFVARSTGARPAGRAERLAGRLRATLDYSGIDDIMGEAMHPYLAEIGQQCATIHAAVYQTYILQQHLDGRRRWVEEVAPRGGDGGEGGDGSVAVVVPVQTQTQTQTSSSGGYSEDQLQQQQQVSGARCQVIGTRGTRGRDHTSYVTDTYHLSPIT